MASTNTKRTLDVEVNNLYNTPIEALEGFYKSFPEVFDSYNVYFDPCNGLGNISRYLKSQNAKVITSDLIDYADNGEISDYIQDFLEVEELPEEVECIIFNPPFKLTKEFVDHAVYLMNKSKTCQSILMFNRASTLFSKERGKRFDSQDWPLYMAYLFSYRVSCTKGVYEEPTANSVDYAFFEFIKNPPRDSEPKIGWIL